MNIVIPVGDIRRADIGRVGGKAYALALMTQKGMRVPRALTITTEAYDTYVSETGLRTRIMMEINRKTDKDIRWEELWDTSLRIRNLFVTTPLPNELGSTIRDYVEKHFAETPLVVRSSAPGEDSSETSFAGLHESYVNVKGTESVLKHIKLVWASLWSDASLLYRQELGLDVNQSSMAVVVQEIISGDVSGISFSQNPGDPAQCVIESVYGLNQALVDGTLEPDRWLLEKATGKIISHTAAERNKALYPSGDGTALASLSSSQKSIPPLNEENVRSVCQLVMKAEEIFGSPQDVEWTIKENSIYILQSRPITTLRGKEKDDKRGWYLSLKKSFESLRTMRHTIEDKLIPDLKKETETLAKADLTKLSDKEVREEADHRRAIFEKWKQNYWEYFIPFAHGMRLFGTIYNDTVHPEDPYEFLTLLGKGSNIISIQRNEILKKMASLTRGNTSLVRALHSGDYSHAQFSALFEQFVSAYGDLLCRSPHCEEERPDITRLIIEMSDADRQSHRESGNKEKKEEAFLSFFEGRRREEAEEMLDIGRASYVMRDNDNIYMGRLKARVLEAEREVNRRSGDVDSRPVSAYHFDSVSMDYHKSRTSTEKDTSQTGYRLQARQITGQPAGPGIATGIARIISNTSDLTHFKNGEVLVCDSIDPNMTFVVPLACAIVERRGGMLIHGAIIAREYGLPCVTGILKATEVIKSGDRVTVDGYLGIVIIASHEKG
jgi:pyruvate,water dikinase